jgi:hypothetical protein
MCNIPFINVKIKVVISKVFISIVVVSVSDEEKNVFYHCHQIEQLKQFKNEVDPWMVKVEALNR